ncbi:MAG: homoserine O-acetyltransferase [Gammaproteobacteria bacterium]|nr:homoserine O-acetyltransferase [Gammaproteobacteria bacterium]MBA3731910.1 homoserine O-acetyltransferase [Gammaproteobacteria bacterium]
MAVSLAALPRTLPAARFVDLSQPFAMRRGGVLPRVRVAYETWGRSNAARDNAVLLFTGLSPSAHAASSRDDPAPGWWEYMVGPGKPIDTDRFFVVCVNSLGSCFGSTGPASIDPVSGKPYGVNFPELTIEDIAAAGHEVMRALAIERPHAVVGASLGGMTALAYTMSRAPDVEKLVIISAAARATAFAIAIRSLQREIICSDPAWAGGHYAPDQQPLMGMRLARKLGMISYRSAQEWQQRFGHHEVITHGEQPFGILYEIESYLDYNARKFVGGFDANCYLYLSRSMDLFDLAAHGSSLKAALSKIQARRATIIGVTSDVLFPFDQQQELADSMRDTARDVRLIRLDAVNGHDSFLIDRDRFAPVVRNIFSG